MRRRDFLIRFVIFYSKIALHLRRKGMRKFFRFFLPLEIFRWVNKFTLLLKAISFVDDIFYKLNRHKIIRKILKIVMLWGRRYLFQQTLTVFEPLTAGLVLFWCPTDLVVYYVSLASLIRSVDVYGLLVGYHSKFQADVHYNESAHSLLRKMKGFISLGSINYSRVGAGRQFTEGEFSQYEMHVKLSEIDAAARFIEQNTGLSALGTHILRETSEEIVVNSALSVNPNTVIQANPPNARLSRLAASINLEAQIDVQKELIEVSEKVTNDSYLDRKFNDGKFNKIPGLRNLESFFTTQKNLPEEDMFEEFLRLKKLDEEKLRKFLEGSSPELPPAQQQAINAFYSKKFEK